MQLVGIRIYLKSILKKLNINANILEGNNNTKFQENQLVIFQKHQKIHIIKNNQLIEEIHYIENKIVIKIKKLIN